MSLNPLFASFCLGKKYLGHSLYYPDCVTQTLGGHPTSHALSAIVFLTYLV